MGSGKGEQDKTGADKLAVRQVFFCLSCPGVRPVTAVGIGMGRDVDGETAMLVGFVCGVDRYIDRYSKSYHISF